MRIAIELARKGEGKVEPNPRVGAVVVRDGRMIASAWHEKFGGPHAEAIALRKAGRRARGADLYVTLEPCVAFDRKKTPPCSEAVVRAGVARIFIASSDPNPLVAGRGLARLRKAGLRVRAGILAEENEQINRPFFKFHRTGLPYVVCKWAMSLDGKIATRTGASKWITSPQARKLGRKLRQRLGNVLIGVGTVLRDDPRLEGVTRIVLDSMARTPDRARLFRTRGRTIVCASTSALGADIRRLRARGAEVHLFEVMDLATILRRLALMGVSQLLIEGGGETHASAIEARLVDEAVVFIAPVVLGGRDAKSPVEGRGVDAIAQGLRLVDVVTRTLPGGELVVHGIAT